MNTRHSTLFTYIMHSYLVSTMHCSFFGGYMTNSTQKLKICHVITRMNLGGAEENTLLTCQGLANKGHDVTLITGLSEGPEGNLLKISDTSKIKIIEIPDIVRPISPFKDFRAYRQLVSIFKQEHFDVVHTHASKAGILGRLAAHRANTPLVVHTVHGQAFHAFQSAWKNAIFKCAERKAAKVSHRIYAVAQAMIDQCVEANIAPREKYKVIYSGMDLSAFTSKTHTREQARQAGIKDDSPIIGVVARIFPQKGYEDLVKCAPDIIREIPNVRFLILGNGTLKVEITRLINSLGIQNNFVFMGMVPPSDVPNYVANMDILIHLSLHEGLPRTVVQAFAGKIPVIAYPVDGTPEVVDNDVNGFLVPVHDCKNVAKHAVELLKNPELRQKMGTDGHQKVLQRFDTQRMVEAIEEDYFKSLKN